MGQKGFISTLKPAWSEVAGKFGPLFSFHFGQKMVYKPIESIWR